MALGGKGVISVLSNVAPQETHDLTQLCFENRYPEAEMCIRDSPGTFHHEWRKTE